VPAIQQAIDALKGLEGQALKGGAIDVSALTKAGDALDNAEIAVSRQLEVLVGKNNARSPQEDAFPEGYVRQGAEYFRSLANSGQAAQKP